MTRYGKSPWVAEFAKSGLRSYPRQRGNLDTDVVVVGGGLTGCATAYAFAAAGIKVALVEGERVARGSSGSSAGWITDDPGVGLVEVEKALGVRAGRRGWQAWRRAALDFSTLVRRLNLKCQLRSEERRVGKECRL